MSRTTYITLMVIFLLGPATVFAGGNYPQFLPDKIARLRDIHTMRSKEALSEGLELFEKGNEWQKIVALDILWFLQYKQYRKENRVFDPILKGLRDTNPQIRKATASYFKRLGKNSNGCCKDTAIVPSLIEVLEDEDPAIRKEAARALAYYKDQRALDPLIKRLQDKDPWVRLEAAFALGELKDQKAILPLLRLLYDDSVFQYKFVQQECIAAIRRIGSPRLIQRSANGENKMIGLLEKDLISRITPVLINKFNDEYLKAEIIKTIGRFRIRETERLLCEALKDSNGTIRKLALEAIQRLSPGKADKTGRGDLTVDLLITSLKDPSADVRVASVEALGKKRENRVIDPLIEALHDSSRDIQRKAIEALGRFAEERILDELVPFIGSRALEKSARKSFLAVSEKTAQGHVYYFKKDGDLYVAQRRNDFPKEIRSSKHMVHPAAARVLIHALNNLDTKTKTGVLELIWEFHSEEIEPHLIKLLNDNSPRIRRLAITRLHGFGGKRAFPYIITALNDKDHTVREKAVRVLGDLQAEQALRPLLEMLNDSDATVREAAARALGKIKSSKAIDPLIAVLSDESHRVRSAALQSLGRFNDPRIADLNLKMLKDRSPYVRRVAARNIVIKPDERAVHSLVLLLSDSDYNVPSIAAEALGEIGDKRAVEPLIKALNNELSEKQRTGLRKKAALALGKIGDKRAVPHLIKALDYKHMTTTAIEALGAIEGPGAVTVLARTVGINKRFISTTIRALEACNRPEIVKELVKCLNQDDREIKRGAILLLEYFGDASVLEPLHRVSNDPDPQISMDATRAINRIKDQEIKGYHRRIKKTKITRPIIASPPSKPKFLSSRKGSVQGTGPSLRRDGKDSTISRKAKPGMPSMMAPKAQIRTSPVVVRRRQEESQAITSIKTRKKDESQQIAQGLKRKNEKARLSAVESPAETGDERASQHLIRVLKDQDKNLRESAARALGELKAKDAVGAIINSLNDPEMDVRVALIWALGEINDSRAVKPLVSLLHDSEERIRNSCFHALAKIGNPENKTILFKALTEDKDYRLRLEAADTLGDIGDRKTVPYLIALLDDRNEYVRQAASRALGKLKAKEATEPLMKRLDDQDYHVRIWAIWALSRTNDSRAVEPLLSCALSDRDQKVRLKSLEALRTFKGSDAQETMVRIFLEEYDSDSYQKRKKSEKILSILDESIILKSLKDPGGDNKRTVRNYIKLMMTPVSSPFRKLGEKALKDFKDRGLVITELSTLIEHREIKPEYKIRDVIFFLKNLNDPKCIPNFIYVLENRKNFTKSANSNSCRALGNLRYTDGVPLLLGILVDANESKVLRESAARALGKIGDKEAVPSLIEIIINQSENRGLRTGSVAALGNIGDKRAVEPLINILKNATEHGWLRSASASALGDIGDERGVDPLRETMKNPSLKQASQNALKRLQERRKSRFIESSPPDPKNDSPH